MSNLFFFAGSLFLLIKAADLSVRFSSHFANSLRISRHVVGFLIVAGISILPETFISITSALQGTPAFGLGTLFGSNVADMTLVFGIVTFFAAGNLKVQSSVLRTNLPYLLVMSVPLVFGIDGFYSRFEGLVLILMGGFFYYYLIRNAKKEISGVSYPFSFRNLLFLLLSMGALLASSHFTVKYGLELANFIQINPALIGMFVVGIGTTLPELFFSIKAVKKGQDGLAMGDLLGTVIIDATIVVGIMAMIMPFSFDSNIVYIAGLFMLLGTAFLFYLMKTGKVLTKKEGVFLVLFYVFYAALEFLVSV